jgi:hypothetical protein
MDGGQQNRLASSAGNFTTIQNRLWYIDPKGGMPMRTVSNRNEERERNLKLADDCGGPYVFTRFFRFREQIIY